MARPFKEPELVKGAQLRIPVTEAEKALIMEAAKLANSDMAPWARQVLLQEAKRQTASVTPRKSRRRDK